MVRAGGADFRPLPQTAITQDEWPGDWPAAVYIDPYGNVMSGVRAGAVGPDATFQVGDVLLPRARTFADVPPGAGLVYENSCGLLEIAVNGGAAAALPGLRIGDPVTVVFGDSASGGAV